MNTNGLDAPAASPEMIFIARHSEQATAVYDGDLKTEPQIQKLLQTVYDKANSDVNKLLSAMRGYLNGPLRNAAHLECKWRPRPGLWQWEHWGHLYAGARSRSAIGSTGIYIACLPEQDAPRLVAWISGRGGLEGRRELARTCRRRLPSVVVASDDQKRYMGMDDCVIWFDKKLNRKICQEEVGHELAACAKIMFRTARPALSRLAGA